MKKALLLMNYLLEIKKRNQLTALEIKLRQGNVKNKYPLSNKIIKLREELQVIQKVNQWNNFLSK
jgi:hypothetical protein